MKPTKISATKYLLVVFLILIIFGITVGLFVNFSKIPLLKSANKIVQVQSDFTKLDSCIFKLYNAENSCRMYVVSGNQSYYNQFSKEIKEISLIMDTIERQNQSEKAISAESFDNLIKQKKIRTAQFIELKKLSDSLINFSIAVDKNVENINPKSKLFTLRQFKSIVKVDTIKPSLIAKPKKKFFGRIFDAINDKGKKVIDSSKSTYVKTVISADTSSLNVEYNKMQLKAINDYYLKLYRINKKLKGKEKELLDVNHQLINSIVNGLKAYKVKEKDYYTSVQYLIGTSTLSRVENLDRFTIILLFLATGLLIFVFFTIYNFYKNEKALIDYSNKASLYALSKSRFLANMSHEIRTPLNSIVGFSEQLTHADLEIEQKEQIGAIRNSSVMLLDVVNDILDFSKYETGKVSMERIPFSPNLAIQDIFESMQIQATKKKIGFVINMPIEKEIYILGDPLRLKQAVMNLLSNAIKFTTNGHVTINANLIKGQGSSSVLKVSIADTGMGINPVDQKIIFDEFAQVYYASTKEKQQGTGLGLAICKKIVEFQGGVIDVKSEEGKGSTFSFELPYETTEKPKPNKLPVSRLNNEAKALEGKKVLLADDNMLNILLASTILKKYKVVFDAAYNGKEALELFNENEYDIILTDIQMPEMGGIELTQKIRNSDNMAKRRIPILGVTANVMQEDRQKYLASGMNELVLKPFLEQELLEKILKFIK
ncbi:ATP-binding protein [Pedobacter fastidiosus]|uniref:histidine kinase n=1 Tax=Pedobacter fastidiosus TaxID=2765361 RepID=A0ABR7KY00_9SPHI|nr:ATP-binding protein [Pedobacter fastidiosus]MBC6112685.1 response regulator [Pedobacter fastidiosus]